MLLLSKKSFYKNCYNGYYYINYYHCFNQYLGNFFKMKTTIDYLTKKNLQSKMNFMSHT